ncbi:hypothetical protein JVT61DRAFT_12107 [Boletus reticuloceps]|uniref:Uncharacterized protein n=1 Tax=Boletus reticuloceps TaxID=495285 RepID=A0A8I3A4F1_9AGAM|nr:hypothetical protein JVT61DRAFT_12107 [Boletus reticuloceps]
MALEFECPFSASQIARIVPDEVHALQASGAETPPLSISDDYSLIPEGSLSSIDLSQLNTLPSNSTRPLSNATLERARPSHTRGHGHRQRIPQARASRTSIYETIHEELSSLLFPECSVLNSASDTPKLSQTATKPMEHPVFAAHSETSSVDSFSLWSAFAIARRFVTSRACMKPYNLYEIEEATESNVGFLAKDIGIHLATPESGSNVTIVREPNAFDGGNKTVDASPTKSNPFWRAETPAIRWIHAN